MDYATARWLLAGAVPLALAGALVAHRIPDGALRAIFGAGLVGLAGFLLFQRAPERCEPGEKAWAWRRGGELMEQEVPGKGKHHDRGEGRHGIEYPTCWRLPGVVLAAVGGALTGLVSAGLPEISTP